MRDEKLTTSVACGVMLRAWSSSLEYEDYDEGGNHCIKKGRHHGQNGGVRKV